MGVDTTRRRRPRARRSRAPDIPQAPWSTLRNAFAPVERFSPDQIEAIHDASMSILEELGIEVMNPRACALFEEAGADVNQATGVVRIDRALLAERIATAPDRFTLTSANPDRTLVIGGDALVFGLVAGPPNASDSERGRRPATMDDYRDFIRLAQYFNVIHLIGNQVVAPLDLPAETRHLDTYHANLTLSDLCFHVTAIGRARALDGIRMMAIARGVSVEDLAASPGVIAPISVNSPRRFDGEMAEGMIAAAEHGQACLVTPFTLMGAMTPVTLPAALAQQNAEALFGVMLTQLVRPGAPVLYGAFTSNVDMRTGAPAFGTPENALANMASGQLARRYGLPYRTSNANASNTVDAQAAYETQMALWAAVLGGANVVYHAAGWLEGGLTASFEKLVLDVEMLQQMAAMMAPLEVDSASLALDAIANVPTGGHFFGEPHTLARYETAFYQPILSDWANHEAWEAAGGLTATDRATRIWKQALEDYEPPQMAPERREALDAYVAQRRAEIERTGL
ncbi:MAG: trimethylamine methyltransferase family protein [Pseudomonadota bacterium]